MKLFGLIGFPLSHSFSKKYFTEKFEQEKIADCKYELFELSNLDAFPNLLKRNPELVGLNITIPYKQQILPFLDELDDASASRIGAVNTIKIAPNGSLKGYNTDYYGFKISLEIWLNKLNIHPNNLKALVLGNGGASKAVETALKDLGIQILKVVRSEGIENSTKYQDLTDAIMHQHRLIINTTPLGTYPNIDSAPPIPYHLLSSNHLLYDLVYNPAETAFLKIGYEKGAQIHNGLPMLHLQADKAWEIWNS